MMQAKRPFKLIIHGLPPVRSFKTKAALLGAYYFLSNTTRVSLFEQIDGVWVEILPGGDMNSVKHNAFKAHCRQHTHFDSLCHLCGIAVIEKLCDIINEMEKKHGKGRG